MKCPHCTVEVNSEFREKFIGQDSQGYWSIFYMNCPNPNCGKLIVKLATSKERKRHPNGIVVDQLGPNISSNLVRPITSLRPPVPPEVDDKYAKDYNEACLIFGFSPQASSALSRRCLQSILRDKANVKQGNLANEIDQVIKSNSLPTHLAESIDAIRNIGNFAAHPSKSTTTGEIVEVEAGEAEWLLDVIEALFDFYFVQPAKLKLKRDALNKKLQDLGKPPMK